MKHSITRQLIAAFVGLVLLILGANVLINNVFLERYYTYSLEKALIRVYKMVDSHVTEDGADKEYFQNTISEECNSSNMSLVVVDDTFNLIALTSNSNYSLMMARLNVVVEQYPELKASDLYAKAQDGQRQYEENVRISRMVYNDTATKMNRMVRQWPSSIVASMLHFDVKEYLKVDNEKKKDYPDLDEAFKK